MVATNLSLAERFAPMPDGLAGPGRLRTVRFTWDEVLELMRLGIVPEDASIELLDGVIVPVERGTNGEETEVPGRTHAIVTEKLSRLAPKIDSPARHVETQQSLWCSPSYVPVPDFMVVRGTLSDYPHDAPRGRDAWCVVEVADSSIRRDTISKPGAYAEAGVGQYVVIRLPERRADVYAVSTSDTRAFQPPISVLADEMLNLRIGDDETLAIRLGDLLP